MKGTRAHPLLLLLLFSLCLPGFAEEEPVVYGQSIETTLIDDFTGDAGAPWTSRTGGNVECSLSQVSGLLGATEGTLQAKFSVIDSSDREPSRNWFAIEHNALESLELPATTTGFYVRLGAAKSAQWWVSLSITLEGGATYSSVIADQPLPAGRIVRYSVPLGELKTTTGESLSADSLDLLSGLSIATSIAGPAFYLDRISAYETPRLASWLEFSTSRPTNCFERGEVVDFSLALAGEASEEAAAVLYEIRDWREQLVAEGAFGLAFPGPRTITPGLTTPGYYEVQAWFADAAGEALTAQSCIRSEGSVPAGLGTFAILPSTVAENLERFADFGQDAFFGLHGDFLGLGDLLGLSWRMGYWHWKYREPERPDRSDGAAPWATEALSGPPEPAYRYHFLPFGINLGATVPDWALAGEVDAPAAPNWEAVEAWVRDNVRVERALYPHMQPRLYGAGWELNLNMPPFNVQQPEYSADEVVELYRRVRILVKEEDPEGLIIGPCPNIIDVDWLESLFQAGLLDQLDGIELHAYNEGTFTPEENRLPEKLARLQELLAQYAPGRELPVYVTERGDGGAFGADLIYREQAELGVRAAIILKGEGVKVFLPFYGVDYDKACYGFCFNLELEPPGPWGTKRISPKPLASAMAASAWLLEGTSPAGHLTDFGEEVLAYHFTGEGRRVLALWAPEGARDLLLPVGSASEVILYDLMGAASALSPEAGKVQLRVGQAPCYVVLAEPE